MDNNFNSTLAVQFGPQDIVDGSLQPLQSGSKQRVPFLFQKPQKT
jgi:hypothetical protein